MGRGRSRVKVAALLRFVMSSGSGRDDVRVRSTEVSLLMFPLVWLKVFVLCKGVNSTVNNRSATPTLPAKGRQKLRKQQAHAFEFETRVTCVRQ
jgi:hypothetical protein